MDCFSCGHPNREGARFCAQCGMALAGEVTCASCGAVNPAATRYCDRCGRLLDDAAALGVRAAPPAHLAEKIRAGRAALEGERKQVTVLFADVMGSMELAERTDPEVWRRTMDRFFSILCEGVHRFEGTVDKFTGDGTVALFGAPIAHEDHARRACHAALHLQRELAAYAEELRRTQGLGFSVRMGLNSGEVVVGAVGEDLEIAYTAVGHTVGLAQRMEQLAEPGRVYLTGNTASLAEGYLALRDLGEFQVKGAGRPVRVHELTGIGTASGRVDVSRARGLSRFVGRDRELRALEGALEQAFAGEGQVVGLVGEAGVGKSRLCREFAERRRAEGTPIHHVAAAAHTKSVPLLPVLQLLRDYFEIEEHDSEETARGRIAHRLLLLGTSFEDDLPLIYDFLAVPDPDHPVPRMDPEARQRRLLGLMKRISRAENARRPGVTLVEDLHWLDPASEAFLTSQVEAVQGSPGLVVVNFRPGYRAPWMSRSYYRQIALAPLAAEPTQDLLGDLLGSDPSLEGLSDIVRERARGNPFFVEELVHALVESGSLAGERGGYRLVAPVAETAVPASVQAALAARIDRLERRDKAVLQAAAVIGKEFPAAVLGRVVDFDPAELDAALGNLVAGEFLYEQELQPEALYAFKHPLTQEVAYGSQLSEHRAPVHAAVARAIAERYPERLDERAALVAQHWEAAGEALEASRWHARAAAWAGTANPMQARRHWRKVAALGDELPESEETVALGMMSRIAVLQYGWRLGIDLGEARALFEEAERLCAWAGDGRARALLLGTYGAVIGLGDGAVREMATLQREAIALAEELRDPALYLALSGGAYAFFSTGEYRDAVAVLDRAIELADGDPTAGAGLNYLCPLAWCHGFKGMVLVIMGELDEARRLIERSRMIAREQGDIEVVGFTHMDATYLSSAVGDPEAAIADARRAVEIAEGIGGLYFRSYAWFFLGLAEGMAGAWQHAIDALERSGELAKAAHLAIDEDTRLALLAEAYLGRGDRERARAMIEQSLAIARAHQNVGGEALGNLALARVLLASADPAEREEAEVALARTLELARASGARTLEPLACVELAELAGRAGDADRRERNLREAHRLFTQIGATRHGERVSAELPTVA